ncbi:MAG TPA: tetratricopeptide repeat protein [Planctomycetota bacterium]
MKSIGRRLLPLSILLLAACSSIATEVPRISPGAAGYRLLAGNVTLPQGSNPKTNCGPEALGAALNFLGVPASISEVERAVYVPAIQGSVAPPIVEYARRKGVKAQMSEGGGNWKLRGQIDAGFPVMIEVTLKGLFHYFLVVGYNDTDRVLVCAYYGDRQHLLSYEKLDELWRPTRFRSIAFSVPPADQWVADGYDCLEAGRYELAEELFLRALKLQPDHAPALAGMGRVRISQRKLPEAADYLERALMGLPDDPGVLNNLADTILNLKGDAARAERLSKECIAGTLRRLAELEEELRAAPPGTSERVRKDIEKTRVNAFYYYGTLGQALEANGRLKESVEARMESLKYPHLVEDDPDAPARRTLEIAEALGKLGEKDRAREFFQKARELTKDPELRARIGESEKRFGKS